MEPSRVVSGTQYKQWFEAHELMVYVLCLRTFQERVFARRTLSFFDFVPDCDWFYDPCPKSLYWVCQQTWWYDYHPTVATESCRSLYKDVTDEPLSQGYRWPDLNRYLKLCQSYSPRDFTYNSDVVIAFAGAATLLAKSFPGGILFGLPVLFFDIALLWDCWGGTSEIRWDTAHDESNRPPSWSWMSRQGDLRDFEEDPFFKGIAYIDAPSTLVITPLVQWYFTGVGGAQIAIANDYHKYKHFAQDGESTLPRGWSRAEPPPSSSGTQKENIYVTPNARGQKFRFPIPLMDPSCSEITIPMPISNRITCQAEHTYFYIRAPEYKQRLHILDTTRKFSGMMSAPGAWDILWLETETKVELIAISIGSGVEHDLWHGSGIPVEYSKPHDTWNFYNVLWVEWTDGVAYRKAAGYVTKSAWEAADRELIDVVLG
jgi:hypothetical protein